MGMTQADSSKLQMPHLWQLRRVVFSLLAVSLGFATLFHLTTATALSQTGATTSGAAPPPTETLPRPTLKPGSQGAAVTELQATLQLLGYYSGSVDGVYGQSTVMAVSQFQQAAGLNADGITGPATWNRLFPAASETATMPTPTPNVKPTPAPNKVTAAPGTSNSAASFPVPEGASPTPPLNNPPATKPRPATKPAQNAATPKPGKTATTPAATAPTTPSSTASPVALPVLRQGMRGSAVVALQERLRSLGVFKGVADGVFGVETLTAVKAAQRSFKLEPDGVVGAGTWGALLR